MRNSGLFFKGKIVKSRHSYFLFLFSLVFLRYRVYLNEKKIGLSEKFLSILGNRILFSILSDFKSLR
ncbi:hypothetical protein CH380_18625 [Leptospira adleri]|uniref:Uncharacterized protein n=1 Tax=Leptospira adleri TaxID=2023186 RepID=A0A2M9YJP9_9LEPT|nr:hypothetical protein CH380_18625 [Leptospira adleri]PJZ60337.1 hypothetical protein CH376_18895 [Leptospira adleri]